MIASALFAGGMPPIRRGGNRDKPGRSGGARDANEHRIRRAAQKSRNAAIRIVERRAANRKATEL